MHVNKEPSSKSALGGFATCFMLASCLAYSMTLKTEATCSSEMFVDFQMTTWHYVAEDRTLGWGFVCDVMVCRLVSFAAN
jgi:hypothetical protein